MLKKIFRHLPIVILIAIGGFLLFSEKITGQPVYYSEIAGFAALVWAAMLIRNAAGKDGTLKPVEESEFFKKLKNEPGEEKEESKK